MEIYVLTRQDIIAIILPQKIYVFVIRIEFFSDWNQNDRAESETLVLNYFKLF